MENHNNITGEAQGVDSPSHEDLKKAILRDLSNASGLITAILSDPDLVEQLTVWIKGRYDNHLAKKDAGRN